MLILLAAAGRAPAAAVEIRFEGHRALSAEELRREAAHELERLVQTAAPRPADVEDAAFQMERRYRREGYPFAAVEGRIEHGGNRVVFRIREGPQVRVGGLSFSGHEALSLQRLHEIAQAEVPGIAEPGRAVYVAAAVEGIADAVRAEYLDQGFRDVVVEAPEARFTEDRRLVDLAFRIREGPRWTVERLDVVGGVPPEAAAEFETLHPPHPGLGRGAAGGDLRRTRPPRSRSGDRRGPRGARPHAP